MDMQKFEDNLAIIRVLRHAEWHCRFDKFNKKSKKCQITLADIEAASLLVYFRTSFERGT